MFFPPPWNKFENIIFFFFLFLSLDLKKKIMEILDLSHQIETIL